MSEDSHTDAGESADRFKAFVDAVVAIAMTLLILPLMESVAEAASHRTGTVAFLSAHSGQLFTFVLSFVLIANFWLGHHRLYDAVERITRPLLALNLAWLLTIVWLPVATAMIGQLPNDRPQALVYVGALIATTALSLAARVYLLRRPDLIAASRSTVLGWIAVEIATLGCFLVTLAAATIWPGIGYFAFFLCMFIGPLHRAVRPLLRRWEEPVPAVQSLD